jgi:hypothetical protein
MEGFRMARENRHRSEADHLPPFSVEIKNE